MIKRAGFWIIFIGVVLIAFFMVFKPSFTGNAVRDFYSNDLDNLSRGNYFCSDCNVILISIDTLRADHLSCYGYNKNTTPNICEFAKDSILFRNMIAQAPSTEPSHASIFTSQIPSHHGALFSYNSSLAENQLTLAEVLKSQGFKTVSFNAGGQIDKTLGFNQGFDEYNSDGKKYKHFSAVVNDSETWIEKNGKSKFFIFLHTFEVHAPYAPSEQDLVLFDKGYGGSLGNSMPGAFVKKVNNKEVNINSEDLKHIISLYDADIYSVDRSFGELISYLKKKGLYDKTIIVLTADHGEEFAEHTGMVAWHSHTLYEELLRVPLIVKTSNSSFAGIKTQNVASHIDIAPTILGILGINSPIEFEGVNLFENSSQNRIIISQQDVAGNLNNMPMSIRRENFKLYNGKFYDLSTDNKERIDVSDEYPSMKKELKEILASIKEGKAINVNPKEYDSELTQQLKSLGYLN